VSGSHPSEYAVLGSALMDNSLLRGPLASLSVRDFSSGLNRAIFGAMLQLSEDGQSFDAMLLAEVLKRQGHFKNGAGILFLDGLTDGVVPTTIALAGTRREFGKKRNCGALNPSAKPSSANHRS
jgi:replicative DNA helicase